jgi:outer membrane receptor for ferrienterochelin and colicins
MKKHLLFFCILSIFSTKAQTVIKGRITSSNNALPFASIVLKGTSIGTISNTEGFYTLTIPKSENKTITASFQGYMSKQKKIKKEFNQIELNFDLAEHAKLLDQVTVTGTRTDKRQTKSPVIVNVISSSTLNNVQACNLAEGLKFQTGLRVETDCQTCNYTQLRMNGLGGGYSQILINGRPIFSPLTGLYGLEQIPTNMINRIEVVRGGGSALYGSSAIGGTVNVITKIPKKNDYSFGYTYLNTKGTDDHIFSGNATFVNKKVDKGISFFFNKRDRALFDDNGDNFSELPELQNLSFGANIFFIPKENQKVEINLSKMYEYRYGGEMADIAPHLTLQSEERTHNVYVGNVDYQINFNDDKSSLITYLAGQYTGRDHYTGIYPIDRSFDERKIFEQIGTFPTNTSFSIEELNSETIHLNTTPYGTSETTTLQGGLQLNHKVEEFIGGNAVFTLGTEFVQDDVVDEIEAYSYNINQLTKNIGVFFQSDWEITEKANLLAGVRFDNHKLIDYENDNRITNNIFSPRISFLYKPFERTQLRATWGKGFRAPQAFDSDLHIAFAGGGVSRVSLSDNLKRETSNSFSASLNFDKPTDHYIYGFTVEGFYTQLNDAFYLHPIGEDEHGELFEKRNGDGALVKGITLEGRLNLDQILQIEAGYTMQSSLFDTAVKNYDNLPAKRKFLRTPNNYGYATVTYKPSLKFKTAINIVQTGKMDLMHILSDTDAVYLDSPAFAEVGIKSSYTFSLKGNLPKMEVSGGVKNIFDAYQNDFDSGKNRDSNYIYGPSNPRTLFIGLKFGSNL